ELTKGKGYRVTAAGVPDALRDRLSGVTRNGFVDFHFADREQTNGAVDLLRAEHCPIESIVLTTTAALIRDTFREAFARKIFWGLFGLSTLMILFFLFIMKIDIVEGATATLTLFGRDHGRTLQVDSLVKCVYGSIATFLYTW